MVAIGIDLGTTQCCVGWWKDNRCEIIANFQGNRTTPSYVSFTQGDILVGESAKHQESFNPSHTLSGTKRLIGCEVSDIPDEIQRVPYTVISDDQGFPLIEIDDTCYPIEEISCILLKHMKQIAEAYIGHEVTDAVITVPAYFTNNQRQSTHTAGTNAGFHVLRILNEPTAAAIAYGLQETLETTRLLVYDLGGGTLDVSLVTIEDGIFEVNATSGDTHLGGDDFDYLLVDYCLSRISNGHEIRSHSRAMSRLKSACELAKRNLSTLTSTTIDIDSLYLGHDFHCPLTRAKFDSICVSLFQRCLEPVKRVLEDTRCSIHEIDTVVLVGGSSRIPKLQSDISSYFGGIPLSTSIHPEEAVACGAAAQAALLSNKGESNPSLDQILLLDVTPLSLGIETEGDIMTPVIERNTTLPTEQTQYFSTTEDDQTSVTIRVFEGERMFTKDNNLLGSFELQGIPPKPRGTSKLRVTFQVNTDGILKITACEMSTQNTNQLTISRDTRILSSEQVEAKVKDSNTYKQDDLEHKLLWEAKQNYRTYLHSVKVSLDTYKDQIGSDYFDLCDKLDHELQWIQESHSRIDYDRRVQETQDYLNAKLSSYHSQFSDDTLMFSMD
jgi:heat shock protein 1/8